MIGVGIISFDSAGEPEMAGVLLALLSGVLFAAYMINLRRTRGISPVYLTWINNLVCALLLLLVRSSRSLALTLQSGDDSRSHGRGAARHALFSFLQRTANGFVAGGSLIALIEPVLNPLWVALVVGEIPSTATLAAAG